MATRSADHDTQGGKLLDAAERDAQSNSESMSSLTHDEFTSQRCAYPASECDSVSESEGEQMTALRARSKASETDVGADPAGTSLQHEQAQCVERSEAMDFCPSDLPLSNARDKPAPPAQAIPTNTGEKPNATVPPALEAGSHMQWRIAPYHTDEQVATAKEAWEAIVLAFDASRGNSEQPPFPTNVDGEQVAHTASAQRPSTYVLVLEQSQPQPPAAAGDARTTHSEARREQPQPPAAPGSAPPINSQVHIEQPQSPATPGSAPGTASEVCREQPQSPAAPGSPPHTPTSRSTGRWPAEPIVIVDSPAAPAARRRPPTPGPARRPTTLPLRPRSPAGRAPAHRPDTWRTRHRYPPVVNIVNVGRRGPPSSYEMPSNASGDSGLPPTDHRSDGTSSPLGMSDDLSQYGSSSVSSGSVRSSRSSPAPSPSVPLFDGRDWPGFMSKFRECARHYKWSDHVKARRLHTSIVGDARKAIGLATGANWSYYQLKRHLEQRYGNYNAAFTRLQQKLFVRRRRPGQSLVDFYEELVATASAANLSSSLRERLVYTAFLYGLYPDSHMYHWIARREQKGTVENALGIAAAYEQEFHAPIQRQPPMVTVNARNVQQNSKLGRYSPNSSPRVMPAAGDGRSLCAQMADGFKKLETHVSTKVAGLDNRLQTVESFQREHMRKLRDRWNHSPPHSTSERHHSSTPDGDFNWRGSRAWNYRDRHSDSERSYRHRRNYDGQE